MLRNLKDKALALAFRAIANERYSAFGTATECNVDTLRNRLIFTATLKGDREPVTATVDAFQIEKFEGKTFLVIKRISTSKAWLSELLSCLAVGQRLPLPAAIALML